MALRLSAVEACILISVFSSVAGEPLLKKVVLGRPASLHCDGKGSLHDELEIMWKTQYQLVANFSKGHLNYGPGFENRVRFEIVDSEFWFTLHINPTVFSDTDTYSCFHGTDLIRTWNLEVTVSPPKEVDVIERGTVTLPCYGLNNRQLASDKFNVQWKKDGKVVLNLTEGTTHHDQEIGYRANIFLDEIRKGDFSMVIKNIEMTDEGNYECFTEKNQGKILNSVKVHVIKGLSHGYRQRVLHYTGDSFIFFVSTDDVEILLLTGKIGDKRKVCKIRGTGAKCVENVRERTAVHQGYLTLKDLTKSDEGTYRVEDLMESTVTEIVLEVRQPLPIGMFVIVTWCTMVVLLIGFIRRRRRTQNIDSCFFGKFNS